MATTDDVAAKHGAIYPLGHDEIERQRLLAQHDAFLAITGEPPLAPIDGSKIRKIVDIGCGVNASMSTIFAERFPHAQVYGVDISPVHIENKPSNLDFIEGNILHLVDDERLGRGTVDLVFSRLLVAGITDWKEYITKVAGLLAPGGWVEMQDLPDWKVFIGEDPLSVPREGKSIEKVLAKLGLDLGTFKYADEIMEEVGLEKCEKRAFRLPWGPEDSDDPAARRFLKHGGQAWRSATSKIAMLLEGESEETINEAKETVARNMKLEEGKWIPFLVVWGRRPERG